MPLVDHLRELRNRLGISLLAIAVGTVVGWVVYDELFALLQRPFDILSESLGEADVKLVLTGISDAFTLQVKIALLAGVTLSSPIWLYELWAFITPGLHRQERRWALVFVAAAVPLFLAGMAFGYWLLPRGLEILIGFTPEGVSNFIQVDRYLSFTVRLLFVFGLAFLLPVVLVMLNVVGILTAQRLRSWWRGMVLGVFVFAAVATPTGDPWTMTILALPMLGFVAIAWAIAWVNDRRRGRSGASTPYDDLDDDVASPLDESGPLPSGP